MLAACAVPGAHHHASLRRGTDKTAWRSPSRRASLLCCPRAGLFNEAARGRGVYLRRHHRGMDTPVTCSGKGLTADRRAERDLVIEVDTGSGETLGGFVLLKSALNEHAGLAAHLTPESRTR
jgi:hypothetical protein